MKADVEFLIQPDGEGFLVWSVVTKDAPFLPGLPPRERRFRNWVGTFRTRPEAEQAVRRSKQAMKEAWR